jgi:hypothetical protein
MTQYVDEINDNIPCPECGQDQCVCDILDTPDNNYYDDDEESEDEEIL